MKSHGKVLKELHHLYGEIKDLTEGQCRMSDLDFDEEITTPDIRFIVSVIPDSGPYKSGKFDFLVKVPPRYPISAPSIKCVTHIYHPNIDDCGEICLSLFDDWCADFNCIMHCVYGLLYLLKNPNLEDPLSPYFCPEDAEDMDTFYKNVRTSLEGGVVDGFIKFKRNIVTTDSSKKENKALEQCLKS